MTRYNPRRLRRSLALVRLPHYPADWPDDVAALAQMVKREGPAMLKRYDPATFGLVAIHPASGAWPVYLQARKDRAALRVASVAELMTAAHASGAVLAPRPGWFSVLLVGARQVGACRLGSASLALQDAGFLAWQEAAS